MVFEGALHPPSRGRDLTGPGLGDLRPDLDRHADIPNVGAVEHLLRSVDHGLHQLRLDLLGLILVTLDQASSWTAATGTASGQSLHSSQRRPRESLRPSALSRQIPRGRGRGRQEFTRAVHYERYGLADTGVRTCRLEGRNRR